MSKWGSPVELERWRRIHVLLWAYAYEFKSESLVSDARFDEVCKQIDLSIDTGHPVMDKWFRDNFHSDTGMWVHKLPYEEMIKLESMYNRMVNYND